MEGRTLKDNSNNNSAYYTGYPDLLDLVGKEPSLSIGSSPSSFSFTCEGLPLVLNDTHSEAWSPLRIVSGNKNPQSQCGANGQLSSQACFNSSSQRYPTLLHVRPVDSTYGSRASSGARSVDDSPCPKEPARSPSVTSSRFSSAEDRAHISEHLLGLNLAQCADVDKSLACRLCPWVGKTPSEKRKHDARHKKVHKCEICLANFGTQNDLERHRKAIHLKAPRCGPSEKYKCFGRSCINLDKLWPRRDNFKAHMQRMHKDEDEEDLMRLSEEWYERNKCKEIEEEIKVKKTDKNGNDKATELDTFNDGFTSRKRLKDESASITVTEETHQPTKGSQGDGMLLAQPQMAAEDSHKSAANNHVNSVSTVKLPGLRSVLTSNNLSELEISEEQPGPLPSMRSLDLGIALMEALALQKLGRQQNSAQQQPQTSLDTSQTTGLNRKSLGNLPNVKDFSENEKVFLLNLVSDMKLELTQQVSHNAEGESGNKQKTALDSSLKQVNRASYPCLECGKKFGRQCDLKKHMARHEKRYGCTFTECFRVFGSKADWKRHENTQHFHSRSFRCFSPGDNGHNECAKLFFREEEYREHLSECHAVLNTSELDDHVSKNQIGKNGQTQYWCGFCRQIKRLKTKGLDAWKERFDHIDSEHFRMGQRIGDWLPPSGHLVKRDLEIQQRESRKKTSSFVGHDELVSDVHSETVSGALPAGTLAKGGRDQGGRQVCHENPADINSDNDFDSASEMADTFEDDGDDNRHLPSVSPEDSRKRKARDFSIYCCLCGDGPAWGATNFHCPNCGTVFCSGCRYESFHGI